jgi:hypothetical protein
MPRKVGFVRIVGWLALLMVPVIVVSSITLHRRAEKADEKKKRDAEYRNAAFQLVVEKYSLDLKPGLTRNDVEEYLKSRNLTFRHQCCFGEGSLRRSDQNW